MPDAVRTLSKKKVGCVCVLEDDGTLAGIITDGDVARNLHLDLRDIIVDDVMTVSPKTVSPGTLAGKAVAMLDEYRISALVVTEDNRPVGIVHFHDLLRLGVV
jgi:arabinose-5-phosphate isomerase